MLGDSLRIGTTMDRSGIIEEVAIIQGLARNCRCCPPTRLSRAWCRFPVSRLAPHDVADAANQDEPGEPQADRPAVLFHKRQRSHAPEHRERSFHEVSDAPSHSYCADERA